MVFNRDQFKQKKKRVVDPLAPPRPNLLSHEKKMKESAVAFDELSRIVHKQQDEINKLNSRTNYLESSLNNLITIFRNRNEF